MKWSRLRMRRDSFFSPVVTPFKTRMRRSAMMPDLQMVEALGGATSQSSGFSGRRSWHPISSGNQSQPEGNVAYRR